MCSSRAQDTGKCLAVAFSFLFIMAFFVNVTSLWKISKRSPVTQIHNWCVNLLPSEIQPVQVNNLALVFQSKVILKIIKKKYPDVLAKTNETSIEENSLAVGREKDRLKRDKMLLLLR